ncbi:hypothetical protein ACHQM5_029502 [Ranunculus cassubicifolius]
MLNAIIFDKESSSLFTPIEGMKKPMEIHISVVLESLDNWSCALGIGDVRSIGSFAVTERRVKDVELRQNNRQGNHLFLV